MLRLNVAEGSVSGLSQKPFREYQGFVSTLVEPLAYFPGRCAAQGIE